MTDYITHIARVLNIKDFDSTVNSRIKAELQSIEDKLEYIAYIETHYRKLEYLTGYQKFLELTEKYKKNKLLHANKNALMQNKTIARKISQKIKDVSQMYRGSEYKRNMLGYNHKELKYESFRLDSECIFSGFELIMLKKIGTLRDAISLQNSNSGSDLLEENLNELLDAHVLNQAKGKKQIGAGDSRVSKMISVKAM